MALFHFRIATENNNYEDNNTDDQVWIANDNGQLIKVEDKDNESD